MVQKDLRGFLAAIEASGDLITVGEEVDWDLELCAFGRLACERDAPAILFRNVKDYGPDWPVFVNPIATWRRLAVAFGLPADTPLRRLYETYAEREQKLIPPKIVEDAPVGDLFAHPLHPYTQGLLESIVSMDTKAHAGAALPTIPGTVPDLISPPSGCRFHPRCKYAFDRCKVEEPKLIAHGAHRRVACFLYEEGGARADD